MKKVNESHQQLAALGRRLRAARLERNDTMAVFAERIGVSEATVRAMEKGLPSVQIGIWCNGLWALGRLDDLNALLTPQESLLDRARDERRLRRQRASGRRP
jgi:transcriptional regulator with XRE-family HTH domain